MNGEVLWNRITSELHQSEKELKTLKQGRWFIASYSNGKLYVDRAKNNAPSSEISTQRQISKEEFLFVHSYYNRWLNGEVGVRHEVSRKSMNTAYIFALIDKFDK
ncbi:hypothetical protein [Sedimentibacter sp.]|uniref:hypothetical protein n=1 Tax=Sedimentibacter sp. TaxID=1960295 RepID=UPI002898EFDF|nr:hypothetical protein [Sedimentibacter sp.]